MAQIISFVAGVFALCIASCFAPDPRAVLAETVTVSGDLTVKVAMSSTIAKTLQQGHEITEQDFTEYAKAFTDLKSPENGNLVDVPQKQCIVSKKLQKVPPSMRTAATEYAQAFADFKASEQSKSDDLEKNRYLVARKLAELGFIVFVSGGRQNYIVVPEALKEGFALYKLIRYVFAELQPGELTKDIKDAQVKQIIGTNHGRIYYKALEFTSFLPFSTVVLTLGSVNFGEFYMESDKICRHDIASHPKNIGKKKVSELFKEYEEKVFSPIFDEELKIGNEPWVVGFGGTIKDVALKFIVEATLDGKKKLDERNYDGEHLKTSDYTLEHYNEVLKEIYAKEHTDVKIKYYFIFKYEKK